MFHAIPLQVPAVVALSLISLLPPLEPHNTPRMDVLAVHSTTQSRLLPHGKPTASRSADKVSGPHCGDEVQKRSLERHRQSRHNTAPGGLKCDICKKGFRRSDHLARHKTEVHEDGAERCLTCGRIVGPRFMQKHKQTEICRKTVAGLETSAEECPKCGRRATSHEGAQEDKESSRRGDGIGYERYGRPTVKVRSCAGRREAEPPTTPALSPRAQASGKCRCKMACRRTIKT